VENEVLPLVKELTPMLKRVEALDYHTKSNHLSELYHTNLSARELRFLLDRIIRSKSPTERRYQLFFLGDFLTPQMKNVHFLFGQPLYRRKQVDSMLRFLETLADRLEAELPRLEHPYLHRLWFWRDKRKRSKTPTKPRKFPWPIWTSPHDDVQKRAFLEGNEFDAGY
jgi:hypothetical protein